MEERLLTSFHPFVLPFLAGMAFVLLWCFGGIVKVLYQLPRADRKRFYVSLITPNMIVKNVTDMFKDCLFHVRLWKRNKLLGYMHSSIAFGWFMLIVLGHVETFFYIPEKAYLCYFPIFFRFFMKVNDVQLGGAVFFFLMDFFLLVVMSGIALAIFKRFRSLALGMRRTTRLTLPDQIAKYALWSIFPLRWIAEGFTAGVAGGSFMTIPINWLLENFINNPENFTIMWWAYSLALAVFFFALPFTRYMHIPAEILLIPMRNAGLKVVHYRKGFALAQVYSCPSCGVCIDACPMGAQKKFNRSATVYLNRQIRRDNERRFTQISETCLMCGKCEALCQIQVSATGLRQIIRSRTKYGVKHDFGYVKAIEAVSPDVKSIKKSDSLNEQDSFARAMARGSDRVLYYAGCMTSLTPTVKRSVVSLLDKSGVTYSLMDEDGTICCGRPLILAGKKAEAEALIAKNKEIIEKSGADILLVSCPICYRVFKEEYKLEGIQVMHYTDYFNDLIKGGIFAIRPAAQKLVYHDPCELGRGCGIYSAPREALATIGEVVPAEKEKVESICCGGSLGSLTLSWEDRAAITAKSVENLMYSKPDKIVTACPLCLKTYKAQSPVEVCDFAQILDENIE